MKKIIILSFFILITGMTVRASSPANMPAPGDTANFPYWISMMQDPTVNFFKVQRAFNLYWKDRPITKGCGWKVFKRWEYMMMNRINPDGSLPSPDQTFNAFMNMNQGERSSNGQWVSHGPAQIPAPGPAGYEGLGRLNVVAFHPTDGNKLYVGSPSGGMWQSSDAGATWTSYTDKMPTLGVSAILVDRTNPNNILIGSGDRDAGDAPGLGVFQSIDGGLTWNTFNSGMGSKTVGKLIQHPVNALKILAATSGGVYLSTDGGANWTLSVSGDFRDILFKPGDPEIVYTTGANGYFFRSSDGGISFTQVTSGLTDGQRGAIAVSANTANYVYLLVSDNSSGFQGLYRSTDSGLNFTLQSSSPNILDWSCDGSGTGGQGWYDLAITANPNNANEIYVGGVDVWKSTNGGVTWTINSHWYGGCSVPAAHADCHFLGYSPVNGKLYAGNDGGVYYSNNGGTTWTDITVGMTIGQIYKLGQSQTDKNKVINGFQDNGTYTHLSTGWVATGGGDGMECAVDYSNALYTYYTLYFGSIFRRYNNASEYQLGGEGVNGITESGAWVTPFIQHETNPQTMFAGFKNIWRCTNIRSSSATWTRISDNLGGSNSTELAVLEQSPANTNILYAARYDNTFYRSDNCNAATPSWTDLTANLPTTGTPTDIETHPTSADIVYITMGNSIYKSVDRGLTWTNISVNLTGIHLNSVVYYKNGPTEALYVGSDAGVYYKDQNHSTWLGFSQGLPANGRVTEIEIYYDASSAANDLISASTYGRGLWQSNLYSEQPSCAAPSNLSATNMTNVSAVLNWTENGTATTWNIELGPEGFIPIGIPTKSGITKPYTYTGLSGLTSYNYYVQSNCSGGITSAWKGPYTFSTVCGMEQLSFAQSFNLSQWPGCWIHQETGGASSTLWSVNNSSNAGGSPYEMFLTWQGVNPAITRLVTPPINTSGISQLNVSFRHFYDDFYPGVTMRLQSSPDGINWTNENFTIVSGSGNVGPALVTIPVTNNLGANTYIGWAAIGDLYQYDAWYIDNVNITGVPSTKTLNLNLFIQGLYAGGGMMNKAQDESGDHFPGNTADKLTIELHNGSNYSIIEYSSGLVDISTSGQVILNTIPGSFSGSYYITVRHRNGIETTSTSPVSFSGSVVNYSFTNSQSKAYGNNLLNWNGSGVYVTYSGDVNQDGIIDSGDMNPVDNASTAVTFGYVTEDINGDGIVDSGDLNFVDNNSTAIILSMTP
jgi:hypothetical protein